MDKDILVQFSGESWRIDYAVETMDKISKHY